VRLQNFQKDAANLKKEFEKAKTAAARSDLLAGSGPGARSPGNDEHRERMAANTQRLHNQGQTLDNARRLVAEMDDFAEDTKNNLRKQGDDIRRTIGGVRETSAEVSRARKMLGMLQRRNLVNKLIIYGVIVFLVLVILLVLYVKLIAPLFSHSGGAIPQPSPNPEAPVQQSPTPSPLPETQGPTARVAQLRTAAYRRARIRGLH